MTWYNKVTGDISHIPDFITYCETELASAKFECSIKGVIEKNISALPGITEYRFSQLQTVEAVLNYLNLNLRKIKKKYFQKYLEGYNRELSSRDAEKYADAEQEVVDYEILINQVALIRNQYLGILKSLEQKSFALGHITRLRVAGMEDATI